MQSSLSRSILRIAALLTAFLLVFDGGFLSPLTRHLSDTTYEYLASAGASMSARVAQNDLNTLSAEIAAEQKRLAEREAALNEREIAARSYGGGEGPDYSTYILSLVLFLIVVLLLLNYVMDWHRARLYRHENIPA